MSKYVYRDKNLRCKVFATGYRKQIELQLQKRVFYVFWINVFWFKHIEDCYVKGANIGPLPKVMHNSYMMGGDSEIYIGKPLDLQKRIEEFFDEYQNDVDTKIRAKVDVLNLINSTP